MKSICPVLLSVLLVPNLNAAELKPGGPNSVSAPTPLTLDALVAEVLDKNPELAFYRAEIAAAKGEQRTATALPNPELATSIGSKRRRVAPAISARCRPSCSMALLRSPPQASPGAVRPEITASMSPVPQPQSSTERPGSSARCAKASCGFLR